MIYGTSIAGDMAGTAVDDVEGLIALGYRAEAADFA